jgi:glycosyltransferase involved in cell wall biosynthesis
MKKHVLFRVNNNLKIGGIQRRLRNLLPRLTDDFEVHVVTYRHKGVFWDELSDLGVHTHFVPIRAKWSPFGIYRLNQLFRQYRADIVHTHNLGGNITGILAAALAGVPAKIGNVHQRGNHWYAKGVIRRQKQIIQEAMVHRLFTDKVLFVSRESLDYFQQKTRLPDQKLMLLHNGLEFDQTASKQNPSALKKKLGIPESKKIVGFVGRITQGKGVEYFLEFAKKVLDVSEAYVFVVVGGKDEKGLKGFKEKVKNWGKESRILFTGEQKDVYDFYRLFDCFLFCSEAEWEGMPGVVLEACSCGLPVISRRNRPVEEIKTYYPNIQFIEDTSQPVQLVKTAMAMPPPDMAPFYREFSIETMVSRTKSLYVELMGEKRNLP